MTIILHMVFRAMILSNKCKFNVINFLHIRIKIEFFHYFYSWNCTLRFCLTVRDSELKYRGHVFQDLEMFIRLLGTFNIKSHNNCSISEVILNQCFDIHWLFSTNIKNYVDNSCKVNLSFPAKQDSHDGVTYEMERFSISYVFFKLES